MATTPNLLQLNNGYKAFGAQPLFDDATFSVNEGEHIGVIGPNGAGKTTLFKILTKEQELDEGQVIRSQALTLGYLSQHDTWTDEETGNSYLERVSRLALWQVKTMAKDLQISEEIYSKRILSLSGGYRMRIKLVGLLGMDPNLMLLDEPTNYLDLETTILLEGFLQNFKGAFLLISHDREFLRRTTDHILEVESGEITKYNGNIDDYFEQKELLRSQLTARAQSQAEKRKSILEFVARFGAKATKAKQAQSRLKSLQKMETIEMRAVPIKATIKIPEPSHVGKSVIKLENSSYGYGDRTIINDVNLEIQRGDHVAVVGLNGAGKSTLLKGLAGTLSPLKGERHVGYQVDIAIFNQHVIEILNPAHSVYDSLEEVTPSSITPQDIRNMAGSLLFSTDHIQKKVKVLSGGEKSRVALGRILLERKPCMLLDEPTNHLDFQTVEALTQALKNYKGTLVVVSHDRGFIRRVATKILEVSNGKVLLYPGTYDEYVWSLQRRLLADPMHEEATVTQPTPQITAPKPTVQFKEKSKAIRQIEKQIKQCEEKIEKLEAENLELNEKIVTTNPELVVKMADNSVEIGRLENEWTKYADELAKLQEQ